MRVAVFGNGSLGDRSATVRDGTVADRAALAAALESLGHEFVYMAPTERSPGDERVVGYEWRGPVDLLVIESRDAAFAPVVVSRTEVHGRRSGEGCPGLEGNDSYDRFCDECTRASLYDVGAIPVYPQAEVVRDWTEGVFDRGAGCPGCNNTGLVVGDRAGGRYTHSACATRPALLLWDFDMNVRRVWGMSGRTSVYETGRFWRRMTPWMPEVIDEIRQGEHVVKVLCPYDPEASALLKRRGKLSKADKARGRRGEDDTWETVGSFDWAYPLWIETWLAERGGPREWDSRDYDLVYTGSDYNRRRRWAELYGRPSRMGLSVACTGVWGNRRKSQEDGEWAESGWRDRVEKEYPEVELLGGTNRQLPFEGMLETLANARVAVQITPDEYTEVGYYTNRIAEATALGVPVFLDYEFHSARRSEILGPWLGEDAFMVVDKAEDVMDRMAVLSESGTRWDWQEHNTYVRTALLERLHPRMVAHRLLRAGGLE